MTGAVPPFGRYAPPRGFLAARRWISRQAPGRATRLLASGLRRMLLAGGGDIFDIEVFAGVRARLHPRHNRCEKAVLTGTQFWDAEERSVLAGEISGAPTSRPFVFVDVGANVGLYSLFACGAARSRGRAIQVTAIEPDGENLRRLRTNAALNGFENIAVLPIAVGPTPGRGAMVGGESNRGERRLREAAGGDIDVMSLGGALAGAGLDRVDCMKVDIEGHDLAALGGYFGAAPTESWPKLLIVEIGRGGEPAMADLCTRHGYGLEIRTKLNAIYRRQVSDA